eukprot:TRINITY_DN3512_c0_g1_i1.p1 TRINITY_DN3512_c0_g1~~TRINITY_DN3512_c0_g1_i1.p1  ORF type:complete len:339 (+),score=113.92 TRINITY_DN3512_c0_g1_i1:191-1207(+)
MPRDMCAAAQAGANAYEIVLQEFMSLANPDASKSWFSEGLKRTNARKNRYTDIIAYDHSRVQLSSGGYINANYISRGCAEQAYIATQAPLPQTFNDFWSMIWESQTPVIVMLSKFIERKRIKAHCYWPSEGQAERFGMLTVEVISSTEFEGGITIRRFKMRHSGGAVRVVDHIHYTEWPDFGVPESTRSLRALVYLMNEYEDAVPDRPIVVHCSAGIGRAGTIIAIHSFLSQHFGGESHITVQELVEHMRCQRFGAVQTQEQYLLIYRVIEEILEQQRNRSRSLPSSAAAAAAAATPAAPSPPAPASPSALVSGGVAVDVVEQSPIKHRGPDMAVRCA